MLYGYWQLHYLSEDFYEDIANDVEKRFHTSNYEVDSPLSKGKKYKNNWVNEQWIRKKDYYKIWCYYTQNFLLTGCVIKRILKCNDYKDCLLNNEIILDHNKDLKVKHMEYILKKLRLHQVVMMIKDCKLLIYLLHIVMV